MDLDRYISIPLPYSNVMTRIGRALEFIQAHALIEYFCNRKKEKIQLEFTCVKNASPLSLFFEWLF